MKTASIVVLLALSMTLICCDSPESSERNTKSAGKDSASKTSDNYSGFAVTLGEDSNTKFLFSDSDASSKSPVIITALGRSLTSADSAYRAILQKHWISRYVPKNLVLQSRSLVECVFKRGEEFSACDRYVFENPSTGTRSNFYMYVGNWP